MKTCVISTADPLNSETESAISTFAEICIELDLYQDLKSIPPDITVGEIISALERARKTTEGSLTPGLTDPPEGGVNLSEATSSKLAHETLENFKSDTSLEGFLKSIRAIGHLWYWEKVPLLEELLRHDSKKSLLHAIRFFVDEEEEFLRVQTDTGETLLEIFSPEDVAEVMARLGRDFFNYIVAGDYPGTLFEYRPPHVKESELLHAKSEPTVVLISTRYGRIDPNHERSKLKVPGDISQYDQLSKMPKFLLNHMLRGVYEGRQVSPIGLAFHQDMKSLFLSYKGADVISFSKANASWLGKADRLKATSNYDRRKQLAKQVQYSWKNQLFKSGGLGNPPEKPAIQVSYYEILRFVDSGQSPDLGTPS